jgi:aminoglycoside/choline kinase family phosphotransferase
MEETDLITKEYHRFFGEGNLVITPLPKSGSDRKYFRLFGNGESVICTLNPNHEENEAFIGFSRHFHDKGLPVPQILGQSDDHNIYFQTDLGDTNLFIFLRELDPEHRFSEGTIALYHRIIDKLILFQVKGIEGLNLDLCYPHRNFDRQSMMWDMNYFKYMFLRLLAAPFNERRLEHDFNHLADFLLGAGDDYFLFRDFQSANIMIRNGAPWFIDYQGGRRGAPQYDIASLLYDAKITMPGEIRLSLLGYHRNRFCSETGMDEIRFSQHLDGFSMIRLMQALGAFGFRGLYENKPTFTESMVPGLKLLQSVTEKAAFHLDLPELYNTIALAGETKKFREIHSITKEL